MTAPDVIGPFCEPRLSWQHDRLETRLVEVAVAGERFRDPPLPLSKEMQSVYGNVRHQAATETLLWLVVDRRPPD